LSKYEILRLFYSSILFLALWEIWLFAFAVVSALCFGAKANALFVRLVKIEIIKMSGGENNKYRRVGNECRLNCFPVAI
jgi:hypothetical protein